MRHRLLWVWQDDRLLSHYCIAEERWSTPEDGDRLVILIFAMRRRSFASRLGFKIMRWCHAMAFVYNSSVIGDSVYYA